MKTKDSLKTFIEENRESFDSQTPPDSSWQKIKSNLAKEPKQFFWNSISFWRVAAFMMLGLSAYLFMAKSYSKPDKQDIAALKGFSDLEVYYRGEITEKLDLVKRYQSQTGFNDDEVTQNLKKLEAMYLVLNDQMKKKPTQDLRDAMVLNFLVRIDLINQQLHKLDNPKVSAEKPKSIQS